VKKWIAAAVAAPFALLLMLMLAFGMMLSGTQPAQACGTPAPTPATKLAKNAIPRNLMPLYRAAEKKYGVPWNVLAAINKIETGFGTNLNVSSAGAQGWMQFMPATWAAYGVDANGDGRKDPADPADAIFAAARYLKASGAPGDLRRAIFAYNHAEWYVNDVLDWAHKFAGGAALGAPVPGVSSASCETETGAIEGSPKHIIDTVVLPLAKKCGIARTVAENDAANARHGPTNSGGVSDHQGPPDQAWAADTSNGSSPTPEMDCHARALIEKFQLPPLDFNTSGAAGSEQTASVIRGGYRFQLIYRSYTGGNHDNHTHFGARRVAGPAF
jgi:hypothetical protein